VFKIELSNEESDILKMYIKTSPLVLIRSKCQAVLMRSKRIGCRDIADIVSRDERTVSMWCKDFHNRRMASIFTGHEDNQNAKKLTKEQKQEIKDVLQKPPSEQGLPKQFWDVPALKTYVTATFGVVYESDRSYHYLLTFANLSFKLPSTFDRRRNEEVIEQRMKEISKEIAHFLTNPSWEVFASDEVRIELETLTRRAWLRRGEETVIKVDRKRESQSYIGFLNQKTFNCHLYDMEWQDQDEVLKALELFLQKYPNKQICIIWDNAAFHKGQKIRDACKKGGLLERVHLVALPPYAPDKNPIEHVWKDAKEKTANAQRDNLEETKTSFRGHIEGRIFTYQI
jgi:transposase